MRALRFQSLLCSRELASVLISFFPRSSWAMENENEEAEGCKLEGTDEDRDKLLLVIEELEYYTNFFTLSNYDKR